MKNILITGVDGMIGGTLVRRILSRTDWNVTGATFSEDLVEKMLKRERISAENAARVRFLSNDVLTEQGTDLSGIDAAVHLAFSRRNCPAKDIAASIDFASAVFRKLAASGTERVINLSSQGVYGKAEEFRTEATPAAPETPYTMAKYAAEVIFRTHFDASAVKDYTNLRLDPVVQSQNLVIALCKQAKQGTIQLRGVEPRFSVIDVEDAAAAIAAMLESPSGWEKAYNVGWNRRRYTLTEVAEHVADTAARLGFGRPEITLDRQDIVLWAGMDSSRFTALTGWIPQTDLDGMIEKIFRNISEQENENAER